MPKRSRRPADEKKSCRPKAKGKTNPGNDKPKSKGVDPDGRKIKRIGAKAASLQAAIQSSSGAQH